MIKQIALVGGTHGNEMSGIQLIQNWLKYGTPSRFDSLDLALLFGNQSAIDANVRFLEEDLNRQFTLPALSRPASCNEAKIAAELNQKLGPKGEAKTDFVIDIHNTTSEMGATLIILAIDEFHTKLARFVKQQMPEANILVEDEKDYLEHGYLCTCGKRGVMIEVGAQPQSVIREDAYRLAEKMAEAILDFCIAYNNDNIPTLPSCEAFRLGENINFPLDDDGLRTAMIHHQLQDADFKPLEPGSPMFKKYDGSDILWHGKETTYPHFINEAAYLQLHVAFATASRFEL
jgi:aspartoacylase